MAQERHVVLFANLFVEEVSFDHGLVDPRLNHGDAHRLAGLVLDVFVSVREQGLYLILSKAVGIDFLLFVGNHVD